MRILFYFLLSLAFYGKNFDCALNDKIVFQSSKMKRGKHDLDLKAFLGREDGRILIKVWMNFPVSFAC
jgi:hypothetical protein